ncbi:hypothetical protein BHE74_00035496 [Ensete ventricosum]|nr:hypothetical protein BHE74_00035496 [Ensete ventricosum]
MVLHVTKGRHYPRKTMVVGVRRVVGDHSCECHATSGRPCGRCAKGDHPYRHHVAGDCPYGNRTTGDHPCGHRAVGDYPCGHRIVGGPGCERSPVQVARSPL